MLKFARTKNIFLLAVALLVGLSFVFSACDLFKESEVEIEIVPSEYYYSDVIESSLKLYSWLPADDGTMKLTECSDVFPCGGTAKYDANAKRLKLSSPVPGDRVEFDVAPRILSNELQLNAQKYQIQVIADLKSPSADGVEPIDVLDVSINNVMYSTNSLTFASKWIDVVDAESELVHISIEMPLDTSGDIMPKWENEVKFKIMTRVFYDNSDDMVTDPIAADDADPELIAIFNADDLQYVCDKYNMGLISSSAEIKLYNSVSVKNNKWISIGAERGFGGSFDGQGYSINLPGAVLIDDEFKPDRYQSLFGTVAPAQGSDKQPRISNVNVFGYVSAYENAGVIARCADSAVFENCHVINSTLIGLHCVGGMVGSAENCTFKDCSVDNSYIIGVPRNAIDANNVNTGDKVGGLVGQSQGDIRLENCTVSDVTISAYRDLGGLVGYVGGSYTISGNTLTNVALTIDRTVASADPSDANKRCAASSFVGNYRDEVQDAMQTYEQQLAEQFQNSTTHVTVERINCHCPICGN